LIKIRGIDLTAVQLFCQTKVEHFDHATLIDRDVGWLDIPMHNAVLVSFRQRLRDLSDDL